MPLQHGVRVGSYEILALLGAGGMGEVYRARDPKLNRDVALKILPEEFACDPDRLARFRREAHVLASLNHPNIAAIHGLEEAAGPPALVLELVEGPTLADRLAQGPIPLDEALPIATQIDEALEAAHDRGVIHRDLKPANIKLRPDGAVKVLDFGLAKALERDVAAPDVTHSPTLTVAGTRVGMILGTAAYMAPEQARGKAVDKRADIWAFGCVLYEMLTARRAFVGDDVSDILASVLAREPELTALPTDTPLPIRRLIRRCLQKEPKDRLHDIADARLEIQEAKAPPDAQVAGAAMPVRRVRQRLILSFVAVCGLVLGAAAVLGITTFVSAPSDARAVRLAVEPPEGSTWPPLGLNTTLAVSPDGHAVAFVARSGDDTDRLWIRSLDALAAQPLTGTEGASAPFWSPDSQSIGFFADGQLKKIAAAGGPAMILCDAPTARGGTWNPGGVIVFGTSNGPLQRVSAAGGAPTAASLLAEGETSHVGPSFLPDGRHFLYGAGPAFTDVPIYIGALDSTDRTRLLTADATNVLHSLGRVVFHRGTRLWAQPFDVEQLALSGEAIPVADGIQRMGSIMPFVEAAASDNGVLAYKTAGALPASRLVWLDRAGKQIGTLGDDGVYGDFELSPDGARVAVSIGDPSRRALDVWLFDVGRGTRTRLTSDAGHELEPVWSPDGAGIVFSSFRKAAGDLYQTATSGLETETVLWEDARNKYASSWSPDGRFILVTRSGSPRTGNDLWLVPTFGDRKPVPFLETPFTEGWPMISPDGRWVAYRSNESGRGEVYVVPFARPDRKWLLSANGGGFPRWRRDGQEIFYLALDGMLMSAAVSGRGSEFEVGAVRPLFRIPPKPAIIPGIGSVRYDVSADGRRFLVDVPVGEAATPPLTLVVNWTAGLPR